MVFRIARLLAAGRLHDQRIHRVLGEKRTFLQRAVLEIHVARVKNLLPLRLDRHPHRAKNVASVMERRADRAGWIEVERALDVAGFKGLLDVVQLAVFEQRILGDAVLDAL